MAKGRNFEKALKVLVAEPVQALRAVSAALRRSVPLDRIVFPRGYSLAPVQVVVELTHRCNLRCACGATFGPDRTRGLPLNRLYQIIEQLRFYRPEIALVGGEPLLDSRTTLFIKKAREMGFRTSLATNGILLDRFATNLILAGLEVVRVTIDGPEDVHDWLRGVPGTYRRAVNGMKRLQEEKRKQRSSTPRLWLETTLSGYIQGNLTAILDLARSLQVERLLFYHSPRGASPPEERASLDRWCSAAVLGSREARPIDSGRLAGELRVIKRLSREIPFAVVPELSEQEMDVYYNRPGEPVRKRVCLGPWFSARILPDGSLAPCTGQPMGSLQKEDFFTIWNNADFCRFRSNLREKKYLPRCLECLAMLKY